MTSSTAGLLKAVFKEKRAYLFVDIVDSTRLLDRFEKPTIERLRRLRNQVEESVLPETNGRFVNSLGDGFLLDFQSLRLAVTAAFSIQCIADELNQNIPADQQLHVRIGLNASEVLVDQHDVYGRDVMICARLMTLAAPGQIVVTAEIRDQLVSQIDAEIEDLGDCYVKHLSRPIRAYQISPAQNAPQKIRTQTNLKVNPYLAVIPFASISRDIETLLMGDIIADEIIGAFSRTPNLSAISRLSTAVFQGRNADLSEISSKLDADYIVSGRYGVTDSNLKINIELTDVQSASVIWSDQKVIGIKSLLHSELEIVDDLAIAINSRILSNEVQRSRLLPLPNLKSHTILMSAIRLMHRLSQSDFGTSERLLSALIERAPHHPIPQAWMANWHVLRVQQGWSENIISDKKKAQNFTAKSLDADPENSLALTIDGFVNTNLLKRLDVAKERYDQAIEFNSDNSLAWLLQGAWYAFTDNGKEAIKCAERARRLSPFDPHGYFYDSLAATAYLTAGDYSRALELAKISLRANKSHTSTLRVAAVAQWSLGDQDSARSTLKKLRTLEPDLTVRSYLSRMPSAEYEIGQRIAKVLEKCGLPSQ